MESRAGKVALRNPGGNASKNSLTCSITLPISWIKEMGFDLEDRECVLSFDDGVIMIEKM